MSLMAVVVAVVALGGAQAGNGAGDERAAITQAALDYAEGYYGGEPDRMERALSPYLSKRGLMARPGVPPFLVQMNADMLVEASRGPVKLAPEARHITVEVMDVQGETASARIFTAQFNDYLHFVKRAGRWQLLSVLWHPPSPAAGPAEGARTAVDGAVREYVAALFAGDASRAVAVIHPDAVLRSFAPGAPGRPRIVREQNAETLAAALAAGMMKLPGKAEEAQVMVLGVDGDIASAKLTLGTAVSYLHLALQQGKWRIVNALSYPPAG